MKRLTITALKKQLKTKSNDELIKEIVELYKKHQSVKDYYQSTMSVQGQVEVLEKYKKIIKNEFFPSRGFGKARLSIARKAVNDFKKLSTSTKDIADIMVFYVEQGVGFTNQYGDIDEPFYSSVESMYVAALKHICKSELVNEFYDRCRHIVDDTSNIGWVFHDYLSQFFDQYFEKE